MSSFLPIQKFQVRFCPGNLQWERAGCFALLQFLLVLPSLSCLLLSWCWFFVATRAVVLWLSDTQMLVFSLGVLFVGLRSERCQALPTVLFPDLEQVALPEVALLGHLRFPFPCFWSPPSPKLLAAGITLPLGLDPSRVAQVCLSSLVSTASGTRLVFSPTQLWKGRLGSNLFTPCSGCSAGGSVSFCNFPSIWWAKCQCLLQAGAATL